MREAPLILFDFGDTLVRLYPSREALFAAAAKQTGIKLSRSALRRAYHSVEKRHRFSSIRLRSKKAKEAFYKEHHRLLCAYLGISKDFQKLHPKLIRMFQSKKSWQPFQDAKPALRRLKKAGYRIGILANWDRNLQKLARKNGLDVFCDWIVSSSELGVEKPNPQIFKVFLKTICCKAPSLKKVFYIGNDYVLDVLSSKKAGLTPILIDRERLYAKAKCRRYVSLAGFARDIVR